MVRGMTSPTPSPEARKIAHGGNPTWSYTAKHPAHGDLTFTAKLPLASQTLEHQLAVDERLASLSDPSLARTQTLILAAALAGMSDGPGQLIDLPETGRSERHDDESGRTLVDIRYYDPEAETDAAFLIYVWLEYSQWRGQRASAEEVDAVKGSSGETSTPESNA